MRKYFVTIGLLAFVVFGVTRVFAQATEPGTNLPLLPNDTTTVTADPSYNSYTTPTAVNYYESVTPTGQTAIDDAETGSEVILLAILSATGGVGLFLIKKYFDFKRYML